MTDLLGEIDIVYVIDATGSMAPYIEEAKRHARAETQKIANSGDLNIRLGLVAYRDHQPQENTFVVQITRFDGDFDSELSRLAANGGGDRPEAVWDGVDEAIKFDWREGADHLIFLIGDSPPHGYEGRGMDAWPQGCPCGLTSRNLVTRCNENYIKVNAHSIAGYQDTTRAFKELTDATNGECTVVHNPTQSTVVYAATMAATSATVSDGREVTDYFSKFPTSTPEEAALDMGWEVNRVVTATAYLGTRGLDKTGKKVTKK